MKKLLFAGFITIACAGAGLYGAYMNSVGHFSDGIIGQAVAVAEVHPSTSTPEEVSPVKSTKGHNSIILSFVGDCTLGTDPSANMSNNFNSYYDKYEAGYFFEKVNRVFRNSDISVANLEGVLAEADGAQAKEYRFRGLPVYASILSDGGITAVNIANNHTNDFNNFGFAQTLGALSATGVRYFGDGYVYKKLVKNVPFAYVGYAQWRCSEAQVKKDITALSSKGYKVIASFHWGDESSYTPNAKQQSLAHTAIDAGALIVVGHHPHVLQPVEYYHDRLIAYSLGNFCFGGNVNPRDKSTAIFQVRLEFSGDILKRYNGYVIPCSLSSNDIGNNYQPVIVEGKKAQHVVELMKPQV